VLGTLALDRRVELGLRRHGAGYCYRQ